MSAPPRRRARPLRPRRPPKAETSARTAPNQVEVALRHRSGRRYSARLGRLAKGFLDELGLRGCELSVSLVTDEAIHELNRSWRRVDRPTDVLSFPLDGTPSAGARRPLGDVVLSLDTARRCAAERGWTVERELERYLAHGLLHLLGYDHHRAADRLRMNRMEQRLLGRGGMLAPLERGHRL